jgi:AcrR family transcriptional regulator
MVSQGSLALRSPGSRRERLERERLFAATIEETREHGYGQSSVVGVAARAGLSKACFEEHFVGVEQCLLQALHSLALQAHAHVLSAYYAPREGPFVEESAIGAEQLLERVLACLTPIAAATHGAGTAATHGAAPATHGAGAAATNDSIAGASPAQTHSTAAAPLREHFHRGPPGGL